MPLDRILSSVSGYYTSKLSAHGPTARGVDWNSDEGQTLRFAQLLQVCDTREGFSLNDYGCGYGALLDYARAQGYACRYTGYDVAAAMIQAAAARHAGTLDCRFTADRTALEPADYTLASGIFNVKLDTDESEWRAYVLHTLEDLASLSERGFGFNALTQYSDPDRMRPDLYYADPHALFDWCVRNVSRHVALLHDYGLYEFTLLVRKAPRGAPPPR
jgi:SAM-dependent methyltransferase